MVYAEYSESGELVREGGENQLSAMVNDTYEFGGCVIHKATNRYMGGCRWVYDEYFCNLKN